MPSLVQEASLHLGDIDRIEHPECLLSLLPCEELVSYPGEHEIFLIPYALNTCSSPRAENPCPLYGGGRSLDMRILGGV